MTDTGTDFHIRILERTGIAEMSCNSIYYAHYTVFRNHAAADGDTIFGTLVDNQIIMLCIIADLGKYARRYI